jgi:3-methyladenine DNA glycosylase AlkD
VHAKKTPDSEFLACLPVAEKAARDERNFVKKAVSWALRAMGGRRAGLHAPVLALAKRLAASEHAAERWVGKDVIADITRPAVTARMAKKK